MGSPKHHAPSSIWQGPLRLQQRGNFDSPPSCIGGPCHDQNTSSVLATSTNKKTKRYEFLEVFLFSFPKSYMLSIFFRNFHQDLPYFKRAQRMTRLCRMVCQGLFLVSPCKVSRFDAKKIIHGEWPSGGLLASVFF
jgi:hypothetical protein